jgi:hypothetical protein
MMSITMVMNRSYLCRLMFADLKGGVKTRGGKGSAGDDRIALEDQSGDVVVLLNHAYGEARFKVTNINVGPCPRVAMNMTCHTCLTPATNTSTSCSLPWSTYLVGWRQPQLPAAAFHRALCEVCGGQPAVHHRFQVALR